MLLQIEASNYINTAHTIIVIILGVVATIFTIVMFFPLAISSALGIYLGVKVRIYVLCYVLTHSILPLQAHRKVLDGEQASAGRLMYLSIICTFVPLAIAGLIFGTALTTIL